MFYIPRIYKVQGIEVNRVRVLRYGAKMHPAITEIFSLKKSQISEDVFYC